MEYYYNMKKLKKFKQCVGATNKKVDEGGEISVSFISVHGHKIGYYLNIHNLKKNCLHVLEFS